MPRFVILSHDWPYPHFDLMLECDGVLRTWRLPEVPELGRHVPAELIADHRRRYLDYEGPVGSDRGWVIRWDGGEYAEEHRTEDVLEVHLHGRRLQGLLSITRESEDCWCVELAEEPAYAH